MVLWEALKDEELSRSDKLTLAYEFDKIFGLDIDKIKSEEITDVPQEITELVEKRKEAKKNKDFKAANELRNLIKEKGFKIIDKKDSVEIKKIM